MSNLVIWQGAIGGFAIGFYVFLQLWFTGKPLGASTGYGYLCVTYSSDKYFCVNENEEYSPNNMWRLWFIVGICLGGALAAITSPHFEFAIKFTMGVYYDAILPDNPYLKSIILFFSGILVGLGARMANGCTSAHAIYGVACLSGNSFVTATLFFLSATLTGQILFK